MEGWGFRDEERRVDPADLTLQGDTEGGGQKADGHFPPSLPPLTPCVVVSAKLDSLTWAVS